MRKTIYTGVVRSYMHATFWTAFPLNWNPEYCLDWRYWICGGHEKILQICTLQYIPPTVCKSLYICLWSNVISLIQGFRRTSTAWSGVVSISMVSWQKGPTRHAYAWQIGPFWQDTLDMRNKNLDFAICSVGSLQVTSRGLQNIVSANGQEQLPRAAECDMDTSITCPCQYDIYWYRKFYR